MKLVNTYQSARYIPPTPGATTWHRGVRCIVMDTDLDSFAQPMTRVCFADGREALLKPNEMGLKSSDVPVYLNRRSAP